MMSGYLTDDVSADQDSANLQDQKKPQWQELKVKIFDSEQAFDDLSSRWKDLASRADATIFMSFEWSYTWWTHIGRHPGRSLFIVTIWDRSKLVGLLPLYKGCSSFGPVVTERRLQLIGSGGNPNEQYGYKDDYGISDFLDILVDKDYSDDIASLICNMLKSDQLGVDTLSFHSLREDSFVMEYLYPLLKKTRLNPELKQTDICPVIHLEQNNSIDDFIKGVKSNARRRFRQTLRGKGAEHGYEIEEIKTREETDEAVENLIALHQNRWNGMGFPGIFYDKRFTGFFKQILRQAADDGRLWFKHARDKEGICASRVILWYNGRYFDYISGFDDKRKSAKVRPGIGLLLDLIEEAIHHDAKSVELLRGEETYKYDFTSTSVKNWKLCIHFKGNQSSLKNILRHSTALVASLFTHFQKERELMNVQRRENGIIKMFPGYISFRWNSLKLKLRSK